MSQDKDPDPATLIFWVIGSIAGLFVCLILAGVIDDIAQLVTPNPNNQLQAPSPQQSQ